MTQKRRQRERLQEKLHVCMPPTEKEALKQFAITQGDTVSHIVRSAVKSAMKSTNSQ